MVNVKRLSSLSLLPIPIIAVWFPRFAHVDVKETVKVALSSLAIVLLDGALMLNAGLLTVVLVRFKSKLPVFLIVKVLIAVVPIVIAPKLVPSKTSGALSLFTIFILFPSTTISWGKSS